MARKKREKLDTSPPAPGGFGGLGALLQAQGLEGSSEPATAPAPAPVSAARKAGRVVLRREKKGRGGKTATVLEGAPIAAADRAALAKRLRKAMGCGAREEGQTVVVQGDQREAAKAWLEKEGATVVVGN